MSICTHIGFIKQGRYRYDELNLIAECRVCGKKYRYYLNYDKHKVIKSEIKNESGENKNE
jgi:hypothetical protein